MTTLFDTLNLLDKKLIQLEKNIENCRVEAQLAKAEMKEVKRFIKELNQYKKQQTHKRLELHTAPVLEAKKYLVQPEQN